MIMIFQAKWYAYHRGKVAQKAALENFQQKLTNNFRNSFANYWGCSAQKKKKIHCAPEFQSEVIQSSASPPPHPSFAIKKGLESFALCG